MAGRSKKYKVHSVSAKPEAGVKSLFPTRLLWFGFFILLAAGIALRLYHLNRNVFYYYDEGMYLNSGRIFLNPLLIVPPPGFQTFIANVQNWLWQANQTDRPLWQLMVDFRILFGASQHYWIVRAISFVMGLGALGVLYKFVCRMYSSRLTAILSVLFLLFLPSHLFYSRSGLPEAATTFFGLLGFYCFFFFRFEVLRPLLAGLFFAAAYFTNYRLLVLPLLMLAGEFLLSKSETRPVDFRKCGWALLVFIILIFQACLNSHGQYFAVTSGWMVHQVGLAIDHFSWSSFFTYPYVLFRLESWAFGLLFFGGAYFVWKREWPKALPFCLVLLWMVMFSFSSDKAVRYMSAVHPFMAICAALTVSGVVKSRANHIIRWGVIGLAVVAVVSMGFKSYQLVTNRS